MLRLLAFIVALIFAWVLLVCAIILGEALWFAEPDVLRGDISSIQSHLDSKLFNAGNRGRLGAAALALIHNDDIVFARGYGTATPGKDAIDAERTLFQVGSVSKAVTAMGAMTLVHQGKVGLDEPVIGLLKRWRFDGSDDRKLKVTIRQLLSHTAGIEDRQGYTGFLPGENEETLLDYLSGVRVSREPGSSFVYTNSATAILQLLIEDVTGQPFELYMSENVLLPLGMKNSTFDIDEARPLLAPAYDSAVVPQTPRRHSIPGAVALYTSARDLAMFARSLSGGHPVLTDETLRLTMQPAVATNGNWGLGLALFTTTPSGGHIVGHDGGAMPSWGAMVRYNPATRNGMVVTVSGGRGAANQLSHDWVYWETGTLTNEARRQTAYGRIREATYVIGTGSLLVVILTVVYYKRRRSMQRYQVSQD